MCTPTHKHHRSMLTHNTCKHALHWIKYVYMQVIERVCTFHSLQTHITLHVYSAAQQCGCQPTHCISPSGDHCRWTGGGICAYRSNMGRVRWSSQLCTTLTSHHQHIIHSISPITLDNAICAHSQYLPLSRLCFMSCPKAFIFGLPL